MPLTFPKTERLTSKKVINRLFDRNAGGPDTPLSVYAFPFRVMYVLAKPNVPMGSQTLSGNVPESPPPPQVLFGVPKRTFKKAVDRNLIRRRCREAYRLNKYILQQAGTCPTAITFLYTARTGISFDEIEKGMKLALKRVNNTPQG